MAEENKNTNEKTQEEIDKEINDAAREFMLKMLSEDGINKIVKDLGITIGESIKEYMKEPQPPADDFAKFIPLMMLNMSKQFPSGPPPPQMMPGFDAGIDILKLLEQLRAMENIESKKCNGSEKIIKIKNILIDFFQYLRGLPGLDKEAQARYTKYIDDLSEIFLK